MPIVAAADDGINLSSTALIGQRQDCDGRMRVALDAHFGSFSEAAMV